jgi:hypothetical protein
MNRTLKLPRMMGVRQEYVQPPPIDIESALRKEFAPLLARVRPGSRIAVAVGSRGISNLREIVGSLLKLLRETGAEPFIFPAMGSHGGATPEGQAGLLATYGITEHSMQVPIRASMDVRQIGTTSDEVPVFCSEEALGADAILVVNRVKPHTDFGGTLGSGLLKMCVIGLGKRHGAAAMHAAASRLGYEGVIRRMAQVILKSAPILGGVAILENQFHETARLAGVPAESMESRETDLLEEARRLMPLLPFEELDLLIVDQIGKNISGAGLDPNVTGRSVHGYSGALAREGRPSPFIRRIFVRDLTAETHGNAIGIGLADVTTTRLVRKMDGVITYINSLTALTPQCAKIPIHFETDHEAISRILESLALDDLHEARIVRIADTLSLIHLEASEALSDEIGAHRGLSITRQPMAMRFDTAGNLIPMEAYNAGGHRGDSIHRGSESVLDSSGASA